MCVRSTPRDASSGGGSSPGSETELQMLNDLSFDVAQLILASEAKIISEEVRGE